MLSKKAAILTLFRMDLFGTAHGWRGKAPQPKICQTYSTIMKLSTLTTYLKKIKKMYKWHNTPFEFCWHQHFFARNPQLLLYWEIQIKISYFVWVFKGCSNKNGCNFDDARKLATLGLLKLKITWNDVIIFVHDVSNKILSR